MCTGVSVCVCMWKWRGALNELRARVKVGKRRRKKSAAIIVHGRMCCFFVQEKGFFLKKKYKKNLKIPKGITNKENRYAQKEKTKMQKIRILIKKGLKKSEIAKSVQEKHTHTHIERERDGSKEANKTRRGTRVGMHNTQIRT